MGISAIANVGKQAYRYGKRVLNATPELIFGTSSEIAGQAMRTTKGSLFTKAQAGWHAIEKAGKGSFFKSFLGNIKSFIPDMGKAISDGAKGLSGLAKLKGGTKGFFKGIGSKLPFIGSAIIMLAELPNVIKATKEKGIFQGIKEVVKSGAKLAGGGLGAAIGTAIFPTGGGLIGWIAGEWLVGKIVGKSYTEEKAEKEQIIAEYTQQQVANPQVAPAPVNPYMFGTQPAFTGSETTNPFNSNPIPYADDIMMQQLPFNMVA